ncbi:hypothetical protein HO133_007637 [Letharia lupina]|uniref:BTB domain-containing protein n=1 Tax=Letharia lupina TaxID=560253 RepID=A0A8H6CQQ2_9LECA|nr:uncharacterized protein HO133_007637 [Letharia lupina]KAF6227909.1 hypothetical protein HO133_007637 [Letharia lupina]
MSTLLWKYYFENDAENFRQVLARATYNASAQSTKGGGGGRAGSVGIAGSPGATLGTSPTLSKSAKGSSWSNQRAPSGNATPKSLANVTLSRADVNWRDSHGVTLLHHIASSTNENASEFAIALLQLPLLDLYVQDEESGWTALHRALYFGNITIARALMDRDIQDAMEHSTMGPSHAAGGLIKIKDREGNSPFDVYGASITSRNIRQDSGAPLLAGSQDDEDSEMAQGVSGDTNDNDGPSRVVAPRTRIEGDEIFAFGSNKNFTLGFGDEDDRQFPERIFLKRPDHLLRRLYNEYEAQNSRASAQAAEGRFPPSQTNQLPALVQYRPIVVQDVQLSKLHSAVLTTDPEANMYMCGFGKGGRLGSGDETTRFGFISVHGGGLLGKKVIHVALGQNHSIAISSEGETFTWGSNGFGQLGYAPNTSATMDEEPTQLLPRQVFGPLKREIVVGAAASSIHTVVHTASSLFTFGKNEGQLGLFDSDARSLAIQNTPRKVAASLFSSSVKSVSAIDKATICLLENHDVWVFSNYGYAKMAFPLEAFSNYFLNSIWGARAEGAENHICKVTSGGDTICAMSSMGDVFTVHVSQKVEASSATSSTTNPSKIRLALSPPQRVWSLKKGHMAVKDVDVSQDGSIVICTESGSVWRRVKRAKIKDASAAGLAEYKAKDYKFSRVPGLTRIAAVRSNTFGAYAAVRRDCDVLKIQIDVECKMLWQDLYPLLPFHGFAEEDSETEEPTPRFWKSSQPNDVATIRRAVLTVPDLEEKLASYLSDSLGSKETAYSARVGTTLSDVRIPVHGFVLAARSESMRQGLAIFRKHYFFSIPEVVTIEYDSEGKTLILFQGLDFITVFNLVLYLYTDSVVDVWHYTRHAPSSAFRYRQIRTELMKIASGLEMRKLEQAVRVMTEPPKSLHEDFELAIRQPGYFDDGNVEVELDGKNVKVHSALMCQRCPFFEGLFEGRAAGLWLSSRREQLKEPEEAIKVDLKHVDPSVFDFVLRHIYADTDEEMFEDVVTTDFDAFLDLVMEVMSVANELMLERLAQCCQKVLGRYVNTRNVCQLLNAVAPCSVTQFKDAALEYICLNLEGMLENHLLNELDEDLILELDEVVRQNQLACLPIAKSGKAEDDLIEKYPQLLELMARSKRIKIDSVSLQTRLPEREAKSSGGSKAKAAFFEDFHQSPSVSKSQSRASRDRNSQSKSPSLRAKSSAADLMFEMEEDGGPEAEAADKSTPDRHRRHKANTPESLLPSPQITMGYETDDGRAASSSKTEGAIAASTSPSSYKSQGNSTGKSPGEISSKQPWAPPSMTATKLDMKDIMAQASAHSVSSISTGLSFRAKESEASTSGLPTKLSQKERKKQQQQQQLRSPQNFPTPNPSSTENRAQSESSVSPWQVASTGPKLSLKDVLGTESTKSPSSEAKSIPRTPSPLTMRQTVPGKAPAARRAASGPAPTLAPTQNRSISTPDASKASAQNPPTASRSSSVQQPIQSIRHKPLPVEPTLQLSMSDILYQQQTEKDIIKEAAAKRSLQEIQEEQAFQEWWDEESRRVREEEELAARPAARGGRGARGKVRGGSRGRGRGRGRGDGASAGRGGKKVGGGRGNG